MCLFKAIPGGHGLYQQTSPFPLPLTMFYNLHVELTLEHPQKQCLHITESPCKNLGMIYLRI